MSATPKERWCATVSGTSPRSAAKWTAIAAVLCFSGTEAETLGFPAPHLFAALIVGLVIALVGISEAEMPSWAYLAAQAVSGVVLGTYVSFHSVTAVGANWTAVVAITVLTLALGVGRGAWGALEPSLVSRRL